MLLPDKVGVARADKLGNVPAQYICSSRQAHGAVLRCQKKYFIFLVMEFLTMGMDVNCPVYGSKVGSGLAKLSFQSKRCVHNFKLLSSSSSLLPFIVRRFNIQNINKKNEEGPIKSTIAVI